VTTDALVEGDFVNERFIRTREFQLNSRRETLIELYVECSGFASTPEAMANGLAYLQIDLIDPEFHAITLAQFTAIGDETKKLLDDAVAADELKPCDTADLARLIQQVNGGAMLDWAVYSKGSLAAWLRCSIEGLLAPYRLGAEADLPRPELDECKTREGGSSVSGMVCQLNWSMQHHPISLASDFSFCFQYKVGSS